MLGFPHCRFTLGIKLMKGFGCVAVITGWIRDQRERLVQRRYRSLPTF